MRSCLPDWFRSGRMQYRMLGAVLAACSGCVGGQTGTEAIPSDGGRGTTQATDNETTTGSDDVLTPSTAGCVGPLDGGQSLDAQTGMNEEAVVDFVRNSNPVTFRHDDGSITNASLVVAPLAGGCQIATSSGPSALSMPVSTQLTTDDARVSLNLSGTVVAYAAAGGGVVEVEVTGLTQCVRTAGLEAMTPCAIVGLDQSPYAATTIGLSARIQLIAGAAQWLGTLRVSASVTGSCSPEPCSISDWVTVSTMSLSGQL